MAAGERLLVAFSGGPDSTALLVTLAERLPGRGVRLSAAHLDHGLDEGAGERARAAAALADQLAVPLVAARREVRSARRRGEGFEAAARRVRYDFLEQERRRLGARYLATAHHREDQIETVLLRLLWGSGLAGLAGMPARQGSLVRPLLDSSRAELEAVVAASGLRPIDDPTNRDLRFLRNRIRHLLLPYLAAADSRIGERLLRLARASARARASLNQLLAERLAMETVPGGVAASRTALARLPQSLRPFALALLHREAGADYPPPAAALRELARQLAGSGRIGCDAAAGWRWQEQRGLVILARRGQPTPFFTYTLQVPGELEIPELSLVFRLRRGATAPWMRRGSPSRAGLNLPLRVGESVSVRCRRPGDRLRPLGCIGSRRLKEVLVDRKVPLAERDRLPLLVVGGKVAWVPGVTVAEEFRLREETEAWIAEIEPR